MGIVAVAIKLIIAYLLGSVSGSLLLGRVKRVDIREMGSGNAGGTNALRTQGFWFALAVLVIDIGKGWLAAAWLPLVPLPFDSVTEAIVSPFALSLACGFCAILGHCYPLYHGFRGGKGVATLMGVLLAVAAYAIPVFLAVFALTLLLTGWVGLASMLGAVSLVPAVALAGPDPLPVSLGIFAVALALFVIYTHRSNLRNMRRGEEYRFERARIRNWFR